MYSWWFLYFHCWSESSGFSSRLNYIVLEYINEWAPTCDFQQCGILTSVDLHEPVHPSFKLRKSKWSHISHCWNFMLRLKCIIFLPFSIESYYPYKSKESTDPDNLGECHELLENKEIVLSRILSQIGIPGNETVDLKAKASLALYSIIDQTYFKTRFFNVKPFIIKYFMNKWQTEWNSSIGNILRLSQLLMNTN